MGSSQSTGMLWICDQCGASLPVGAEHLGKQCRCRGCGLLFVVTAERLARTAGADLGEESSGPPHDGAEISNQTAPYALWGVDEAPLPSEIARRQPKWFPVYCHNCDTLLHATKSQLGTKLVCHDCGAKTVVKAPPLQRTPPPVPPLDGYELDEAVAPGPRPTAVPAIVRREEAERKKAIEQGDSSSEQSDPPRPIASGSRPKMPRVPLIQGVLPMLWNETVLVRWIMLSLGLTLVGSIGLLAMRLIQSGYGAIMGVWFLAAFSLTGLLWFMAAAALWLAILTESSEGRGRLYNPPGADFTDWMGDLFYVAIASTVAAVPAAAIAALVAGQQPWAAAAAAMAGWLLFFPVTLLSALEIGSPFGVFSPRLAMTLVRRLGAWLLFTIESCLLLAAATVAAVAMVHYSPWLALLAGPGLVAASLIYFRLLGRFAWWMNKA